MVKKIPISFHVDENGCFVCDSHKPYKVGYAYMWHRGKRKRIHKHMFEEMFGPVPDGLLIRHKCDNRICMNPEHLELGTDADNARDRNERGRTACGEKHGRSCLTDAEVFEIKKLLNKNKLNCEEIARLYFVSPSTINKIKNGLIWKHVKI